MLLARNTNTQRTPIIPYTSCAPYDLKTILAGCRQQITKAEWHTSTIASDRIVRVTSHNYLSSDWRDASSATSQYMFLHSGNFPLVLAAYLRNLWDYVSGLVPPRFRDNQSKFPDLSFCFFLLKTGFQAERTETGRCLVANLLSFHQEFSRPPRNSYRRSFYHFSYYWNVMR